MKKGLLKNFVKSLFGNPISLATCIFIFSSLIIFLTVVLFYFSNKDSQLSNSYEDLSKKIRDLDINNFAISVPIAEYESIHRELDISTTLIESHIFTEKNQGDLAREAYRQLLLAKVAIGLENSDILETNNLNKKLDSIKSISDYWNLDDIKTANVILKANEKVAENTRDVNLIINKQLSINGEQNLNRLFRIPIFWLTIVFTILNAIFGLRSVFLEQKRRDAGMRP